MKGLYFFIPSLYTKKSVTLFSGSVTLLIMVELEAIEASPQAYETRTATITGRARVISTKLDLEEITRLTDEFTRRNPSWEWRLVRKEGAPQR